MKALLLLLLFVQPCLGQLQGLLKQSTAATVVVTMISSTDHISGATAQTLTIRAMKNGTDSLITPTVAEISAANEPGNYTVALTTGNTDTLGQLKLHLTCSGCDPQDPVWQVVAFDPTDPSAGVLSTALPGPYSINQSGGMLYRIFQRPNQ